MKRTNGKLTLIGVLIFYINIFLVAVGLSQSNTRQAYEGSFLYLTNEKGEDYPNNGTPSWGDNDWSPQGIAHDDENWYICSNGYGTGGYNDDWIIWKIPIKEKLDQDFNKSPNTGSQHHSRSFYDKLDKLRYNHVGDLDCCRYGDDCYLVVPLTGPPLYYPSGPPIPGTSPPPAIAFFDAAKLELINYAELDLDYQPDVGWCAVDSRGEYLFTSKDTDVDRILKYKIDWDIVLGKTNHNGLSIADNCFLYDRIGLPITSLLQNMQGGEFSPSGELLFVNCGKHSLDLHPETDGMHVFDTATWERIDRSYSIRSVRYKDCPMYFDYAFDNSFDGMQEPEGLTYWDLNDGRAGPEISGELHVLLMNYAKMAWNTNKVSLKHFTRKMYVDANAPPPTPKEEWDYPPLCGTKWEPFNTVADAFSFYCHNPLENKWYGPWDGAEIVIKAGNYPEKGVFSNRVRIVSEGGPAIIGK